MMRMIRMAFYEARGVLFGERGRNLVGFGGRRFIIIESDCVQTTNCH